MVAIKVYTWQDDITPLLSSVEWCVLRLLLTVSDAFIKVTESLVVPPIWELRTSLTKVLDEDEAGVLAGTSHASAVRVCPC